MQILLGHIIDPLKPPCTYLLCILLTASTKFKMRRSSFQPVRSPFSSEKVIMMTSTVAHPSVYSSAHLLLFLVRLQLLASGCMDVFKGPLARHAESRTCGLNERRTELPKPNNQGTLLLTDATPATAASFGKSSSWSLALIWIWFLTTTSLVSRN